MGSHFAESLICVSKDSKSMTLTPLIPKSMTLTPLIHINRELKRRTRVASIFPNSASCLRLISALLTEFDEEWITGKIYLTFKS